MQNLENNPIEADIEPVVTAMEVNPLVDLAGDLERAARQTNKECNIAAKV